MSGMCDVSVKVVSQKGRCFAGHKVGEEWLFRRDMKSPAGLCNAAFAALFPHIRLLQGGGGYSSEAHPELDAGEAPDLACPDADCPVIFRVRRLPQ